MNIVIKKKRIKFNTRFAITFSFIIKNKIANKNNTTLFFIHKRILSEIYTLTIITFTSLTNLSFTYRAILSPLFIY